MKLSAAKAAATGGVVGFDNFRGVSLLSDGAKHAYNSTISSAKPILQSYCI